MHCLNSTDGAVFAIVGSKSGPNEGYLWQYRIEPGPSLSLVRKFGKFSGIRRDLRRSLSTTHKGFAYYPMRAREFGNTTPIQTSLTPPGNWRSFGKTGYMDDREGLAIYATGPETGYLVSTDQILGGEPVFPLQQRRRSIATDWISPGFCRRDRWNRSRSWHADRNEQRS